MAFHIHANIILAKRKFNGTTKIRTHNHANVQTNAQPFNQFMFCDTSHNSIIMLSLPMTQHIIKIIIIIIYKHINSIHGT